MKNSTYNNGILTVNGKRYTVTEIENQGNGHCRMFLREEGPLDAVKETKAAEWVFPERLESLDDYDWEYTAFLKRVW